MVVAVIGGTVPMVMVLVLVLVASGTLWFTRGRVLHEAERLFSKLRGAALPPCRAVPTELTS